MDCLSVKYQENIQDAMTPLKQIGVEHLVSCFVYSSGKRIFLSDHVDYIASMEDSGLIDIEPSLKPDNYVNGVITKHSSKNPLQAAAASIRAEKGLIQKLAIYRRANNLSCMFQLLDNKKTCPVKISAVESALAEYTVNIAEIIKDNSPLKDEFPILCDKQYRDRVFANFSDVNLEKIPRRGLELLDYIKAGFSQKEIANYMNVSEQRVKNIYWQLIDIFNAKNRDELRLFARSV